jgi:hypothetical protein
LGRQRSRGEQHRQTREKGKMPENNAERTIEISHNPSSKTSEFFGVQSIAT